MRGDVPAAGAARYHQMVYRNAANDCTPKTRNDTHAARVEWAP